MFYRHSGSILFHLTRGGVFFGLFDGVGDLIIKNNRPIGFLLRFFRLCYLVIAFLPMIVSHSYQALSVDIVRSFRFF